jgi:3'(2'), 5'-bisphosphate nucleotidase
MGVPAEIFPPKEHETVLSTKYHTSDYINNFMARLPLTMVKFGGTGLKCTYVALGNHTAYIYPTPNTKKWDSCAPEALLNSVGGVLLDMYGNNYLYHPDVEHVNQTGLLVTKKMELVDLVVREYA